MLEFKCVLSLCGTDRDRLSAAVFMVLVPFGEFFMPISHQTMCPFLDYPGVGVAAPEKTQCGLAKC